MPGVRRRILSGVYITPFARKRNAGLETDHSAQSSYLSFSHERILDSTILLVENYIRTSKLGGNMAENNWGGPSADKYQIGKPEVTDAAPESQEPLETVGETAQEGPAVEI